MTNGKAQAEPTMEEILASIRRIISEDEQQAEKPEPAQNGSAPAQAPAPAPASADAVSAAPAEDVLELTEVVNDDGSVSSLKEPASPAPPEAEPEPFPEPSFEPEPEAPAFARAEAAEERGGAASDFDLLSESAASSAAASFAGLLGSVSGVRSMHLGNGAKTLEDLVKELLRPMLKDWLDRNLPPLVERLVAHEIAKIAGRAERD